MRFEEFKKVYYANVWNFRVRTRVTEFDFFAQVNGHEVPLTSPPHVAIYEIASMLEHSCVPNCNKSFSNDGELIIRATRFIPKGEHISICYTDPLWSTLNRLEHLAMTKFFLCQCVRCTDPTELGTYYSALNCFNK